MTCSAWCNQDIGAAPAEVISVSGPEDLPVEEHGDANSERGAEPCADEKEGACMTDVGPQMCSQKSLTNQDLLRKGMTVAVAWTFFVSVVLGEILFSQLPVVLAMALPTIIHDYLVGQVVTSQHELQYESEWHRQNSNATFNVHISWTFWEEAPPGALASYPLQGWAYWLAAAFCYTWMVIIIPRYSMDWEAYRQTTSWRYLSIWTLYHLVHLALIYVAVSRASQVDGEHNFAALGSLSPNIPFVAAGIGFVWHRGRQITRVTGNNYMKIIIWSIFIQTAIYSVEVLFLIGGLTDLSIERKEFVLFIYRLWIWPLIWCCVLMPVQRFALLAWEGEHSKKIAFLTFFWLTNALSSRTLMFQMSSQTYFMVLVVSDTLVAMLMNLCDEDMPIFDQIMHRLWIKRCLGELPKVDRERAGMVRCIWFQAQSLVELIATFSQGFREWAFYDSRYVFGNMYRPACGAAGFDYEGLLFKVGIAVAALVLGDIGTSYVAYLKDLPLKQGFRLLIRTRVSWISFCGLNLFMYMLTVLINSVNVGRTGSCADYSNGCTCATVAIYREICGCCSANATAVASSPYALCKTA